MKPRYNHAYDIAFTVDTNHDRENVTREELLAGLRERLQELSREGSDEIIEASGMPFDTIDRNEDE